MNDIVALQSCTEFVFVGNKGVGVAALLGLRPARRIGGHYTKLLADDEMCNSIQFNSIQ